jgi:hypothetical protein
MKNLMFWKDVNEPGRPGRIAYLIDVFCLIVSFGFIVGLVLMWAVSIGAVIYLSVYELFLEPMRRFPIP